jgi:hypothetical protein
MPPKVASAGQIIESEASPKATNEKSQEELDNGDAGR